MKFARKINRLEEKNKTKELEKKYHTKFIEKCPICKKYSAFIKIDNEIRCVRCENVVNVLKS